MQVYGDEKEGESSSAVLHDIVEVVGILSKSPELAALHMHMHGGGADADEDFLMGERLAAHPPTSQVC